MKTRPKTQKSGEKLFRRKSKIRGKSAIMRIWNERFQVTHSKDNESFHPFYKEYFDKPFRVKPD